MGDFMYTIKVEILLERLFRTYLLPRITHSNIPHQDVLGAGETLQNT